jgi:hypothetical protein
MDGLPRARFVHQFKRRLFRKSLLCSRVAPRRERRRPTPPHAAAVSFAMRSELYAAATIGAAI